MVVKELLKPGQMASPVNHGGIILENRAQHARLSSITDDGRDTGGSRLRGGT